MNCDNLVFSEALLALDTSFDTKKWALGFGIELKTNQVEIVDTMCKPGPSNIVVLASRSGGKTYGVAIGAIRLCLTIPEYKVIVFGPNRAQSTRIITELTRICANSYLSNLS